MAGMNPAARTHAVILAAGYSTRMGGRPKALRRIGSGSMLSLAVNALRKGGVAHIHVVTGHGEAEVTAAARELGTGIIHNQEFARGMFHSLCEGFEHVLALLEQQRELPSGLAATNDAAPGCCLLLPVDAALVHSWTVSRLLGYWRELAGRSPELGQKAVLVPAFAGQSGHPPLLGAFHLAEVLRRKKELAASDGMRGYMAGLFRENAYKDLASAKGPMGSCRIGTAPDQSRDCANCPDSEGAGPKKKGLLGADIGQKMYLETIPGLLPAGRSATPAWFVPLPDAGIIADLDRPHDCARAESFLRFSRNRQTPVPEEAWEWLRHSGNKPEKIRHCLRVAQGALRLAQALRLVGRQADPVLHLCAGLLHDLVGSCAFEDKKCKAHALRAEECLAERGWPYCAVAVGAHTVLPGHMLSALGLTKPDVPVVCRHSWPCRTARASRGLDGAKEIASDPDERVLLASASVYLADKYFFMDRQVSIAERFGIVRERFAADSGAVAAIGRREAVAVAVAAWFQSVLGADPALLVAVPSASSWESWLDATYVLSQ